MGKSLVSAAGQPLPFWRLVLVRGVFFGLMFLVVYPPVMLLPLLDHVFIFGKRRRCLHDLAAGTMVVRRQKQ